MITTTMTINKNLAKWNGQWRRLLAMVFDGHGSDFREIRYHVTKIRSFPSWKKILNNKFKERCNQSHIKLIYSIQRWGNLWNRWALLIWHLGRKILILGSPLKIQGLGRKIGKILFFAVLKCFCCFQFWRPDIGFERVGQLKFPFGGN